MKTISVMTNDSGNPETNLTVSGNVEKFVTITPPVVRLNGNIGEDLKTIVKIVPEAKYPFAISKLSAQDGKNIKYELKEEKSASGGKDYSVTVENTKKDAGFYYDVLILATDSKIQPEIKINVMSRIVDPKAPANAPLTGNSGNILTPGAGNSGVNTIPGTGLSGGSAGNGADAGTGKGKNFLEVIQQIQKQNQQNSQDGNINGATVDGKSAPAQDPKRAEELKKKFEALIKQAQEKKSAQEQQKAQEQQSALSEKQNQDTPKK